jgi:hypothetical protein
MGLPLGFVCEKIISKMGSENELSVLTYAELPDIGGASALPVAACHLRGLPGWERPEWPACCHLRGLPGCWERPEFPACEFDLQDAAGFRFRVRTSPFPGQSLQLGRPGYCREPSLARRAQGGPATGPRGRRYRQSHNAGRLRVGGSESFGRHPACLLGYAAAGDVDSSGRPPLAGSAARGRVPWRTTPTWLRRGAPHARLQAPQSRIERSKGRRAHGTRAPNSPSGDRA